MPSFGFWSDVRYAVRSLRRAPAYTAVMVVTLTIGIGANTAIFSVINGVLLRPLPYPEPDRLAMVFRTVPRFGFARSSASFPDFADWREQARSFERLAAYGYVAVTYQGEEGAERWEGYRVTADLLPTLGATTAEGRFFSANDDAPGAAPAIVLGHGLWQSRFGGRSDIVGAAITLDGEPHTVVGVMAPSFAFPTAGTGFWVPLRGDAARMERDSNFLTVLGRLAPGVSVADAQREMEMLAARIDAVPGGNEGYGVFVESRQTFVVRNAQTALWVFLGAVAIVLVVACANVANLMLARGTGRHREIAVRTALGADRSRLVRQLLTESTILAGLGGVLGVGLAIGLVRVLRVLAPAQLPRVDEIGVDIVALGFTAAVAIGCGLVFGTVPALFGSRADPQQAFRHGGQAASLGRIGRRVQRGFATAQIALAVVLSVSAGLLINSFARLTAVEPGFDPTSVVAARVELPRPSLPREMAEETMQASFEQVSRERDRFYHELGRRLAAFPAVQSVGFAYGLPFGRHSFSRVVQPEGMEVVEGDEPVVAGNVVAGDYLTAMGIAVQRGRPFTDADDVNAPSVAIVNETMARFFWPEEDPLGKRFIIGDGPGAWTTVVGVAADVRRRSLDEDLQPAYYRPLAQASWPDAMFVALRSEMPPSAAIEIVRREVWALDPRVPLTQIATASELIAESVAEPRFRAVVLGVFGGIAVVLAMIGVYGVMAHAVSDRTREIGIRMALGAAEGAIARMVLRAGAWVTAMGLAAGVVGAIGLTRFLSGMLFGLTPRDPTTFVAVATVLGAVSVMASYLPARRAARVDPLESLRNE